MTYWTSLLDQVNRGVINTLGREVQYVPAGSAAKHIKAIFEATSAGESAVPGARAIAFVRLADLDAPPATGDQMVVDGLTYKLHKIEADGQGGARLGLHLHG